MESESVEVGVERSSALGWEGLLYELPMRVSCSELCSQLLLL